MANDNNERLARAISEYEGEYVLVRGDDIVEHDKDLSVALQRVEPEQRRGLEVRFAPTRNFVYTTFSAY